MNVPRLVARLAAVGAGAALVLAATAATAPAQGTTRPDPAPARQLTGTSGSIVFIRGDNVWIARGDGSRARRVTSDGTPALPYLSPSESDGGIIAAAHGTQIVRMTQTGQVLGRIDPPSLRNSAGETLDGIVNEVAISPDGRLLAYGFVRYSCPVGVDCMVRYATGYTLATRLQRVGRPTYFHDASWIGSSRTIQTGGYGSQVMLQDLGAPAVHWFDDSDYAGVGIDTDLADGDLSPDGRWLAEIRGYGATASIAWFQVRGDAQAGPPPAYPQIACLTGGEPLHASPTWSPDSTALAWAAKDGIWILRSATVGCGSSAPSRLALPGGSAPDWSPAPLS